MEIRKVKQTKKNIIYNHEYKTIGALYGHFFYKYTIDIRDEVKFLDDCLYVSDLVIAEKKVKLSDRWDQLYYYEIGNLYFYDKYYVSDNVVAIFHNLPLSDRELEVMNKDLISYEEYLIKRVLE